MVRPQHRAHSVCTRCHARKVKCDLEHSPDDVCGNCRRFKQSCIKRTGIRKRQKVIRSSIPSAQRSPESIPGDATTADEGLASHPGLAFLIHSRTPCLPAEETRISQHNAGFIASHSVLAYDELTPRTMSEDSISCPLNVRDAILSATEALILPVPPLRKALIDVFFEQVYHDYPVVELEDVSAPDLSILLQQGVCLAASLMRHGPDSLKLSQSLYEKVKILIYLNYEPDSISTLKTLCLLSCWSVKPPDKMSLDGPWFWTGMASRVALQMGLQESTYANHPSASCLRRIFWQLHSAYVSFGFFSQLVTKNNRKRVNRKDTDFKIPLALRRKSQ